MRDGGKTVWIFSFWTDVFVYLYKHQQLDIAVPFSLPVDANAGCDVTALPQEKVLSLLTRDGDQAAYDALKRDFHGIGPICENLLNQSLDKMLNFALGKSVVFVFLTPDRPKENQFNQWLRAKLLGQPDVHLVDFLDFLEEGTSPPSDLHFDRQIYKRVAEHISGLITERFGSHKSQLRSHRAK